MIPRLEPMLAVASETFDSDDHLYEVKKYHVASPDAIDLDTLVWLKGRLRIRVGEHGPPR